MLLAADVNTFFMFFCNNFVVKMGNMKNFMGMLFRGGVCFLSLYFARGGVAMMYIDMLYG